MYDSVKELNRLSMFVASCRKRMEFSDWPFEKKIDRKTSSKPSRLNYLLKIQQVEPDDCLGRFIILDSAVQLVGPEIVGERSSHALTPGPINSAIMFQWNS
jgi:hypothetical protein